MLALLLAFTCAPAPFARAAAPITVTSTADDLATNGNCTLREAIRAANTDAPVDACPAGGGADTIVLPSGFYGLHIGGADEDAGLSGDLDILQPLTITGALSVTTIIDGGALDRVFDVHAAGVRLAHITVQHGYSGLDGGGILNRAGGLTLDDDTVMLNRAVGDGGGVLNQGTLTLGTTVMTDNSADNVGGGLANQGMLAFHGGELRHNTAFLAGGGLYNAGEEALLVGVMVSDNVAIEAAGISNAAGTLMLMASEVAENVATEDGGGGILNRAMLELHDSMLRSNQAHEGDGGGLFNSAGHATLADVRVLGNMSGRRGGGISNSGTLDMMSSAVISNTAESHPYPFGYLTYGGGIANSGVLTATNSTVGGNMAFTDGGGVYNRGEPGLPAKLRLYNVTISGNMADSDMVGGGDGGGLFNFPGNGATLRNTLLAGNMDATPDAMAASMRADCAGTLLSEGHNLVGDTAGGACAGLGAAGDRAGDSATGRGALDPRLGALAGAQMPSDMMHVMHGAMPSGDMDAALFPLRDGSPAIDAGDPHGCADAEGMMLMIDQRGMMRPHGVACDIGAYEYDGPRREFVPFAAR